MNTVLQYVLYLVILVALAVPLGFYIKRVMEGEKTFLSRILTPVSYTHLDVYKRQGCGRFTGVSEARNRYLCCTKFAVSLYGKVSETYLCVL